jgi:uncharacterized protein (DUF1810 family)
MQEAREIMHDPDQLNRFVEAQDPVIDRVRDELRAGRKNSHWMWYIFPQISGLGHSAMAQRYAIASRSEALAYFAHPVLGPRLLECTELMNGVEGRSATQILGSPDDMKFHSSMTLFAAVQPDVPAFQKALAKYFAGALDRRTVERLAS